MIGAMDPVMAVDATLRQICTDPVVARLVGVPAELMAIQAQERSFGLQHAGVVGTVRVMTVGAIFPDGRMLPQEWAALFGVAGVAGLVHGGSLQEFGPIRTVRVVAAGAIHFPFADRHMRGFQ